MKTIGLIVNPFAGIGGKVGLKGSDGERIRHKAFQLGAIPEAHLKAMRTLAVLRDRCPDIKIITYPGKMGFEEADEFGFDIEVIDSGNIGETTSEDTMKAAEIMLQRGVDMIVFAGGDGTARDVCSVVGTETPVMGIPAGVKIHSGVYGTTPERAGEAAAMYLLGKGSIRLAEREVMDIDEDAVRADRVSARLYGYMKVPFEKQLVQSAKAGSSMSEQAAAVDIASGIVYRMKPDEYYFIGAGTTTREILNTLNLPHTLLGIDIVKAGQLIVKDANERDLLDIIHREGGKRCNIIVTIIGGQGYLFGRGNQQFSAEVINAVGKDRITVAATEEKILGLGGKPLIIDTGDKETDMKLCGHTGIVTGNRKWVAYRIEC